MAKYTQSPVLLPADGAKSNSGNPSEKKSIVGEAKSWGIGACKNTHAAII